MWSYLEVGNLAKALSFTLSAEISSWLVQALQGCVILWLNFCDNLHIKWTCRKWWQSKFAWIHFILIFLHGRAPHSTLAQYLWMYPSAQKNTSTMALQIPCTLSHVNNPKATTPTTWRGDNTSHKSEEVSWKESHKQDQPRETTESTPDQSHLQLLAIDFDRHQLQVFTIQHHWSMTICKT